MKQRRVSASSHVRSPERTLATVSAHAIALRGTQGPNSSRMESPRRGRRLLAGATLPRTDSRRRIARSATKYLAKYILRLLFRLYRVPVYYELLREERGQIRERESENGKRRESSRASWRTREVPHTREVLADLHPRSHPRCNETCTLYIHWCTQATREKTKLREGRCASDK